MVEERAVGRSFSTGPPLATRRFHYFAWPIMLHWLLFTPNGVREFWISSSPLMRLLIRRLWMRVYDLSPTSHSGTISASSPPCDLRPSSIGGSTGVGRTLVRLAVAKGSTLHTLLREPHKVGTHELAGDFAADIARSRWMLKFEFDRGIADINNYLWQLSAVCVGNARHRF